ncbi:septation ring formation regulator EzrA [Paenibacillus daejeonensis]|uniref:septation ring formation regulator EzrA n=1 Tax=Paenibacillus daejeonensis TaxID=135193 RepID=UPI00146B090B|nr:septation ring formation regulator EzrA [Paenibacillus daejeonensis]
MDRAEMLPDGAAERLSAIRADGTLPFYVLTLPYLGSNQTPARLATHHYNELKLGQNDVLLVIFESKRVVELTFVDPELQMALDQWAASQSSGSSDVSSSSAFLDRHFVTLARDGQLEEALGNLMLEMEALVSGTAPTAAGTSATVTVISPSQNAVTNPNGLAILGVSAGLLLFFGALWLWTSQLKLRQLQAQEARIPELMAATERCRDQMRPFAGFVQGQTEQHVDQIDRSLSELLLALDSLRNRAGERQTSLLRKSRTDRLIIELQEILDQSSVLLERIGQQIAELADTDKRIRTKTDKLGSRVDVLREKLEQLKSTTGYPLTVLAAELERLNASLAAADQLEVFDPVAASREAAATREAADHLEEQLSKISVYDNKLSDYAKAAAAAAGTIESLSNEHNIQVAVARLQLQSLPDQSSFIVEHLEEQLRQGNVDEVARLDEEVERLLTEAVERVRLLGKLKQQNLQDLDYLARKCERLADMEVELNAGFEELQGVYHESLWQPLQREFQAHCSELQRMRQAMDEVRLLTGEEEQAYEQAHERLARWLETAQAADRSVNACRTLLHELDQRVERARLIHAGLEQQLRDLHHLISTEQLTVLPAWDEAFADIRRSYTDVTERLQRMPYPLDRIEKELAYCAGELRLVENQINTQLAHKREAERLLHVAHGYYDRFANHAYASRFHAIHTQSHQLFMQGRYEESVLHMRHADQLIREMLGHEPPAQSFPPPPPLR